MTNYYYTHNPDIVHDEKQWNFEIFNHSFKFTTDNGVFSKRTWITAHEHYLQRLIQLICQRAQC